MLPMGGNLLLCLLLAQFTDTNLSVITSVDEATHSSRPNVTCAHRHPSGFPLVISALSSPPITCHHCHALLLGQTLLSQGCWDPGHGCSSPCTLSTVLPSSINKNGDLSSSALKFCCCSGNFCNTNWRDVQVEKSKDQKQVNESKQKYEDEIKKIRLSMTEIFLLIVLILLLIMLVILLLLLKWQSTRENTSNSKSNFNLSPPILQQKSMVLRCSLENLLDGPSENSADIKDNT